MIVSPTAVRQVPVVVALATPKAGSPSARLSFISTHTHTHTHTLPLHVVGVSIHVSMATGGFPGLRGVLSHRHARPNRGRASRCRCCRYPAAPPSYFSRDGERVSAFEQCRNILDCAAVQCGGGRWGGSRAAAPPDRRTGGRYSHCRYCRSAALPPSAGVFIEMQKGCRCCNSTGMSQAGGGCQELTQIEFTVW